VKLRAVVVLMDRLETMGLYFRATVSFSHHLVYALCNIT